MRALLLALSIQGASLVAAATTTATIPAATANPLEILSQLSTCAVQCLEYGVPRANCGLLDLECQCASKNVTTIVAGCMRVNCTVEEDIELFKVVAYECGLEHDSRNPTVRLVVYVSTAITFAMIFLRVFSRLWSLGKLWWDDWFHIMAGAWAVPMNVFAFLAATHGIGKHIYDLQAHNAENLLFWTYLCQIFWATATFFVKVSILCLYLRIFPLRPFRLAVFATMALLIICYLIIVFMTAFQCVPTSAIWQMHTIDAKCLNIFGVATASAATNIAVEVIILILPLPVLKTLKVDGRRKISLYMLFSAGIITIIIASLRIPSLKFLVTYNDPSYQIAPTYYWTCAETTAINIVAAAPALKQLFVRTKGQVSDKISVYKSRKTGSYALSNLSEHGGGYSGSPHGDDLKASKSGQIVSTSTFTTSQSGNTPASDNSRVLDLISKTGRRYDTQTYHPDSPRNHSSKHSITPTYDRDLYKSPQDHYPQTRRRISDDNSAEIIIQHHSDSEAPRSDPDAAAKEIGVACTTILSDPSSGPPVEGRSFLDEDKKNGRGAWV